MVGYKIAFHEEHIGGQDVFTGLHYESIMAKIPVLVVLDIPDDAKTSTPENRYTEENMSNIRAGAWRGCSLMPPYALAALRDCAAYLEYKDEDPLSVYSYMLEEMDELIDAVRDGKIDSRVADKYLTEELNTLRCDNDERT